MRENILTPIAQGSLCWVDLKTRVSKHEVPEPSIYCQDLPVPTQEVGNYRRLLNFLNGSIHYFSKAPGRFGESTSNPKNSRTGSPSLQCSMTLIGQIENMMKIVPRAQRVSRTTRWNSCKDTGRSRRMVGLHSQWNDTAIQRIRTYCVYSTRGLSRGILKRKRGFETNHFNEESTNTELLFQTIHSVNQLSIYGELVPKFGLTEEKKGRDNVIVNNSFLTSVPPDEVQYLVSLPTVASGNRLQQNFVSFEALSSRIQFSKLCEDARFQHRVSDGIKKLDMTRATVGEELFPSVGITFSLAHP